MRVPALRGRDSVEIVFPTWAPGSYLVRDFVRHVFRLAVTDAQRPAARARAPRQAALADPDRRAALRRPLSRVRVRGQRAHVVPRRQPRLLERHQPVLLRRGRARTPVPRHRGAAARGSPAGGSRPRCRASRAAPTRPPTSTSSCDAPVRDRHARDARVQGRAHEVRAGALRPLQRRHGPAGRHPAPDRRRDGAHVRRRRLPVRPLPVHRARAAGRLGRPRAPRVGDDGHRRPRRSRTRPATSASPIWPRTNSFTPGT